MRRASNPVDPARPRGETAASRSGHPWMEKGKMEM
jgi:hypothetical protein